MTPVPSGNGQRQDTVAHAGPVPPLDRLFGPESIVIIGVSSRSFQFGGVSFLQRLIEAGYPGRLYPVNPRAEEIKGLKCYPDLASLPEVPDLAIVCIPAAHVPAALEECGRLGIRHIHILTSGFKEINTPEGIALEERIAAVSAEYDLKVVGPNCMGPYSPASGLTAWGAIPGIDGPLGVISQSGGMTQRFTELVCSLGVGIAKAVSLGNATVLDVCDYLAYMGADAAVRVIAIYLENVRDSRELLTLAREVNREKPVILFRGGTSDAGIRTIASHTGAMAGSGQIWSAFYSQTGVIPVLSPEEWTDTAITMALLPDVPVNGGVFLGGGGGGLSAVSSDLFHREGLAIPELSAESMRRFAEEVPAFGSIAGNPLDSFLIYASPAHLGEIAGIVLADPAVSMMVFDRLIMRQAFHLPQQPNQVRDTIRYLKPISRQKPAVVTIDSDGGDPDLAERGAGMRREYCENGIVAFPSVPRAARALANYRRYQRFKHNRNPSPQEA